MKTTRFLLICSLAALGILMVGRLRLGLVRYFDADEFMYLNWAAHMAARERPYIDFLLHVTPVYSLVLTPIFWFTSGVNAAIVGRIVAWVISGLFFASVAGLFWELRKSWIAVAAAIILAMLPMPSDKLLEIRPDMLAVTLLLAGYTVLFRYFRTKRTILLGIAGVLLALSFLTVQKTGPGLAIGSLGLVFYLLAHKSKGVPWMGFRALVYGAGVALPFGVVFAWAVGQGGVDKVAYSMFRLPVEVLAGVVRFNQLPWNFYFLPNSTYYGQPGQSIGLVLNHGIWILGLILAIARLASVMLLKVPRIIEEAIMAASFLAFLALYIWVSPLKFPQYLVPASAFVAFYLADWLSLFWMPLRRLRLGRIVFAGVWIGGLVGAYWIFTVVHGPKFAWTNAPHLSKMQKIYDTIPKTEYVLDLEGRTIYYPYPHPVCCLAFGQFETYLSRPLPPYRDALQRTKTRYIYQAEINRIGALSAEDQEFIYRYYEPREGGELWVAKEW